MYYNYLGLFDKRIAWQADIAHQTMMKAAVQAKQEGICVPILLGNPDRLNRVANRLKLDISDIEIVDMRADKEQGRRATYAKHLAEKRAREGYTFDEAYDKMYERNYFGMSMVENGDADAFITGLYTKYSNTIKVAKDIIGIRPEYKHFGTMHILNTKKGVFYIADTLINRHPDAEVLADIAKLAANSVSFFNDKAAIAMLFGDVKAKEGGKHLSHVVIQVKGTNLKTQCDASGHFKLSRKQQKHTLNSTIFHTFAYRSYILK